MNGVGTPVAAESSFARSSGVFVVFPTLM